MPRFSSLPVVARRLLQPLPRYDLKRGFEPSRNPWEWLGHGIYFFEESEGRARSWVRADRGAPVVIGAAIDLAGVMDLTEQAAIDSLEKTAVQLEASFAVAGQALPENTGPRHTCNWPCASSRYPRHLEGVRR